ncbi:uncharacterized protein MYCFIDRAFT_169141 [Pseudocercospora fijiensis CIRAD86]|uniref:Uncharacterized protein n=1 Tax=Pseudocercospora fijiensis (strain CIRAD86) TaxID=383855 RepID=N1Q5Q9_PSEFD|nr:uncharacterized protein MYCFIDRAFT_169141 [Pseudocercospora fijiensis CIRAD86]EME87284.1 hypothetical protein MYCFIDRAFT_169141 [Pseudocercospora fijiensis CIRAD86]
MGEEILYRASQTVVVAHLGRVSSTNNAIINIWPEANEFCAGSKSSCVCVTRRLAAAVHISRSQRTCFSDDETCRRVQYRIAESTMYGSGPEGRWLIVLRVAVAHIRLLMRVLCLAISSRKLTALYTYWIVNGGLALL